MRENLCFATETHLRTSEGIFWKSVITLIFG